MKKDTTKNEKVPEKTNLNPAQEQTLIDTAAQLVMALESDKTPEAVKDCLKTIIIEASSEASATTSIIGFDDLSLVRQAFPDIIKNLNFEYGRGVLHSIDAILRFDTTAVDEFYEKRLDEKPTDFGGKKSHAAFVEFLASLDEWDTAREIRSEKTERAKELLSRILSVATGDTIRGESNKDITFEETAANLLELLEMFMIRHENFSRNDLAENLQIHLFQWSKKHDKAYSEWRFENFSERGLDDNGNEAAEVSTAALEVEKPQVLDLSELPESCRHLNTLANDLSNALRNPAIPARLYNVITDELTEIHIDTNAPENILANLKAQLKDEPKKSEVEK